MMGFASGSNMISTFIGRCSNDERLSYFTALYLRL